MRGPIQTAAPACPTLPGSSPPGSLTPLTRTGRWPSAKNACQHRLRVAKGDLWSGLHPDALGLLSDDTHRTGISEGSSVIAGLAGDAIRFEHSVSEAEGVLLPQLQEVHWTVHRAFSEHERLGEDRRHLVEVGELIAGGVSELIGAGWTQDVARTADVRALAAGA